MKKIILSIIFNLCFLLIFPQTINAQIRHLSIGAGTSLNFFQRDISDPYFQHFSQFLPHFHLKLETSDVLSLGLTGQLQTNFYTKQIRLGYRYENTAGGKVTEGFHHDYASADIVLSVGYNHRIKPTIWFQPRLGYFFSFNQYIGATEFTKVTGGGTNTVPVNSFDVQSDENPFFIYPGIFTGFSVCTFYNSRAFIIFTDFYIAPRNIFSAPFEYQINGGGQVELQGKYHYLNMGIRVGLNRE